MRKTTILLFFIIFTTFGFSKEILLKNLRFNGNPPQMVIDVVGNVKPKYTINYDNHNRLLFIEFFNTRASSNLKNKILNGTYVKKVNIIRYPSSTGIFIFFNKNVNYSANYWSNPIRFVLDFDKNRTRKEYTIIVDAGHGGKDPGAVGFNKYNEKDIALNIAKYLKVALEKDFNVIMTRNNDSFKTLSERPSIGNRNRGNFFVSIHLNANNSPNVRGADVFYFSRTESDYAKKISSFENSFASISGEKQSDIKYITGQLVYKQNKEISAKVAQSLVTSYSKKLQVGNRGAHGANFAVLRGFDGPGILVEAGFITNSSDITKLKQAKYQKLAANEIAKAIKNHFY